MSKFWNWLKYTFRLKGIDTQPPITTGEIKASQISQAPVVHEKTVSSNHEIIRRGYTKDGYPFYKCKCGQTDFRYVHVARLLDEAEEEVRVAGERHVYDAADLEQRLERAKSNPFAF